MYNHSNTKREPLIAQYISHLSGLIREGNFTATRHYAVFSVSCNPSRQKEKLNAMKKLQDITLRFSGALNNCSIAARTLETEELINFAKHTLR